MSTNGGLLPEQIPPQTVSFGNVSKSGGLMVDINWYLFLYNLASKVLSPSSSSPVSQVDLLDMIDLEAATTDISTLHQEVETIKNQLSFFEEEERIRAGTPESVTGTSPLTYTATRSGSFVLTGVSATTFSIVRYGTSINTGLSVGVVPLKAFDQVSVAWSGGTAPTMTFLPDY